MKVIIHIWVPSLEQCADWQWGMCQLSQAWLSGFCFTKALSLVLGTCPWQWKWLALVLSAPDGQRSLRNIKHSGLKGNQWPPCLGSTHLLQTLGCESQRGAYSLMTLSGGRETNVIAFQPLPFRPGSLLLLLGSHARPLGLFPEKGPSLLPAHCPAMWEAKESWSIVSGFFNTLDQGDELGG